MVSKKEYLAQANLRKDVTLPSGLVVTLRKLTGHDVIREGGFSLQTSREILSDSKEKSEVLWNKMNDAQKKAQVEANDKMIVQSVVSPKLSLVATDTEELSVRDLSDEDYFAILKAVGEFSSNGRQDLKPFREGSDATHTGPDSSQIQGEAKQTA